MDEFELALVAIRRNKFIPEPPPHRNFASPDKERMVEQGIGLLRTLVRQGLKPSHALLDVGCGIGRLALPATQYMGDEGRYFGVDINLSGIAWCHENITQRYKNFEFAVINAANVHYRHPAEYGQESATLAVWPIPQGRTFDFACAFSLYTHLLWDETAHYIAETAKRLKPGGCFISTWFLVNDETAAGVRAGTARHAFRLDGGGPTHLLLQSENYSRAIAHDEDAVVAHARSCGLETKERWTSGWHKGAPGQDHIVFTRV